MKPIERWQIKSIYALGSAVGLVERGRKDDNLHQLTETITGKEHISELSYQEASGMINVLKGRMRGVHQTQITSHALSPTGCTAGQRNKIWRLMYELQEYDEQPSTASLGDRLAGIIKRELQIDASAQDPLHWLTYRQASLLIEAIKRYVSSAAARRRSGGTD